MRKSVYGLFSQRSALKGIYVTKKWDPEVLLIFDREIQLMLLAKPFTWQQKYNIQTTDKTTITTGTQLGSLKEILMSPHVQFWGKPEKTTLPQSRKTVFSRKEFFSTHRVRSFLSALLDMSLSWPSGMARNGPVLSWLEECSWNVVNLKKTKTSIIKKRTLFAAVFLVAQTEWLSFHHRFKQ